MVDRPRGQYFEEFKIGNTFNSEARTITEDDVIRFADLSGDHNRIHTDANYASKTIFGERIAHGMLGLSVVSGLAANLGFTEDTVIALRSIDWKFKSPIKIGDSIKGSFVVSDKRELVGKNSGLIIFDVKVFNQADLIVQTGKWVMIIKMDN